MKRITTIILSAATAAALLLTGAAAGNRTDYASAADGETYYPDFTSDLELDSINNYAVGDGSFAFVSGRQLYIYQGDTYTTQTDADGNRVYEYTGGIMDSYAHSFHITDISYSTAAGGYLFEDSRGYVYLYSDGDAVSSSLTIPTEDGIITNGSLAYSTSEGTLSVTDMAELRTDFPEGYYSSLKKIDGKIYVLRDGELCLIEGSTLSTITISTFTFSYTDIAQEDTIAVGNTATLLKAVNNEPQFVTIPAGQRITEIDLTDLTGNYLTTVKGDSGYATTTLESATNALVLCTTGNADMVAIGSKTYITYSGTKTDATVTTVSSQSATLISSASIYSMPFMSEATKLAELETGATMTVSARIEISAQDAYGDVLMTDFSRVSYTAADGTVTVGYVATSLLSSYDFSGETGEFSDPTQSDDYSEENVILTVVLVIVIVVLVIAGVAYLSYVSGVNRRKKKELKDSDNPDGADGGNDTN